VIEVMLAPFWLKHPLGSPIFAQLDVEGFPHPIKAQTRSKEPGEALSAKLELETTGRTRGDDL
jgi:hypothetical protein